MQEAPRKQSITRIVITGGPCAGKTTAMSWIQNAFTRKGYLVLFVDETATQLSNGGAPWKLTRNNREYQYRVTQLMLAKEEVFTAVARTFEADKVLVVCDRGALDNRAYMTDEEFRYVQEKLGMSEVPPGNRRQGCGGILYLCEQRCPIRDRSGGRRIRRPPDRRLDGTSTSPDHRQPVQFQ